MEPHRNAHVICGFAISERIKGLSHEEMIQGTRRYCFPVYRKDFKWIALSFFLWIASCFIFSITTLIISFVDCTFFAKLFYLTNWNLLLVTNFYVAYFAFIISERTQLDYDPISFNHKFDDIETQENNELSNFNSYLLVYLLGSHFIAFFYALCVLVLYPMIYFFGGKFDTGFLSISAHLVLPITMIITMWFGDLPWHAENVYKVAFFANLYLMFTGIHHKAKLGHLGDYPSTCEPSYWYSIAQQQYYVYKEVQYSNDLTLFLAGLIILVVLPALVWFIHFCLMEIKN